ncbi:MAG: TetM/TetW/TetO/TetS family tetracycline resistance ribosomal protection protein [Thermomicrobia bacterium]|nr:TetM/TetW/TetO/TetS family tetracycline resistance ribosomal protection protein [Thermomicrobia bacterium]
MAIVNIGILAHVDAGKTTLTERILFETGVIASVGSVDKGTTQTDTTEMERARGITILSAVVSFPLHTRKVNLIDTPGHTDFVAEVERSLRVLDGVVLVLSSVEGVQPQTRRLARAIRAAHLPMLIFVNKIDRLGARGEMLLEDIRRKLNLRVVAMNSAAGLGERSAAVVTPDRESAAWRDPVIDLLAETNERVIAEFDRTGGDLSAAFLAAELRAQIASGAIVPVFFGSAITGAGVPELLAGIEQWLPTAEEATDAPTSGTVFKIARRASGEKLVYVRLFAGGLAVRQRVLLHRPDPFGAPEEIEERITGIDRFAAGGATPAEAVSAGEIAALHGLRAARIGDRIGPDEAGGRETAPAFPAPALESIVRPVEPGQITRLRAALEQLAEQDPLIALRQRNDAGELTIRLYGEVQKEVVMETLERDYGVAVTFGPSRTICIERVVGTGAHAEIMGENGNPFYATVGLRVEPAERGSGIRYLRELGALPLAFYRAIEETMYETFTQGLSGWEVTDALVTLTHAGFSSVMSTGGDFRKLTPLVLMRALLIAGTEVCEPVEEFDLEIPEDTFGAVSGALMNARATLRNAFREGTSYRIIYEIPTAELRAVEQQLPALTRGDGSWVSRFAGHVPVAGDAPIRARIGLNPLNRAYYLADIARS